MENTPEKVSESPPISPMGQMCTSKLPDGIRLYSTVYKLRTGMCLHAKHFLQALQDHPFHTDHDATFFFLQHENDELTHNRFFRVYRHYKKGFCIQKGNYIITNDGMTENWSVDGRYECDDLKKIGEDLSYFSTLEGI